VAREHKDPGFQLRIERQRHVDGHLIAVEVCIECRAHHGMDADGLSLHEHRLEGLNAETVEGRSTVQQHGVAVDDVLQDLPHFGSLLIHHLFGALHGLDNAAFDQLPDDERL